MPQINQYQNYTVLAAGGTISFPVTEKTLEYNLIPTSSPLILTGNLTVSASGTPTEGATYIFNVVPSIAYDSVFITIFGYQVSAGEAFYGCQVICKYINGNWRVKSIFGGGTGIVQSIDGKYIQNSTIDGDALKAADIALSKLVVAAARGYALRAGVGGVPEYFNAITAGQVLMGNGTDVVSQAITGAITLNSAGVATIPNNYVTQAMLAYTPVEYYEAELSITSAQVLALNGTPLTIVAAPGSGKYIDVVSATSQMTYVSAAYATNTTLQLINDGATVAQAQDTAILISTVTKNTKFQQVTAATAGQTQIIANTALQVKVGTGNPITGDSAIKVSVIYRIVTL
jgi:hypothetical protein